MVDEMGPVESVPSETETQQAYELGKLTAELEQIRKDMDETKERVEVTRMIADDMGNLRTRLEEIETLVWALMAFELDEEEEEEEEEHREEEKKEEHREERREEKEEQREEKREDNREHKRKELPRGEQGKKKLWWQKG